MCLKTKNNTLILQIFFAFSKKMPKRIEKINKFCMLEENIEMRRFS